MCAFISQNVLERRRYFRLRYPSMRQPILYFNAHLYPIEEISEGGLIFQCASPTIYHPGQLVQARVQFIDGFSQPVTGRIHRGTNNIVVIQLTKQMVPLARIYHEQIKLNHAIDYMSQPPQAF